MDPWYDYVAFPVAPLLVGLQALSIYGLRGWERSVVAIAMPIAFAAMRVYVVVAADDEEGANIGAGLIFFALVASVACTAFALAANERDRRSGDPPE